MLDSVVSDMASMLDVSASITLDADNDLLVYELTSSIHY